MIDDNQRDLLAVHGRGPVVISVKDVSKSFGATKALGHVSLEVREGESHGLLGRNGAGKSTLVSIMTGITAPDDGVVEIHGERAPRIGDRGEWLRKVACVYQKSRLVPQLSVAENICLNSARRDAFGRISWREIHTHAKSLLEEWDIEIDPRREVSTLSIAQRRLIELARALSFGCRFVILDEPTAGLDGREVQALLGKIGALQKKGVTFLYISHHLEETFVVCQAATVLRDGRTVLSRSVSDLNQSDIVAAMIGEAEVGASTARRASTARLDRSPVLEVRNLCCGSLVKDVSFNVQPGEIKGLAGLAGSGKSQIANCIAGRSKYASGAIVVDGRVLKPGSTADAIAKGVGFVGEDRHFDGFIVHDSIAANASMSVMRANSRHGIVNLAAMSDYADSVIKSLSIKASSRNQPVSDLSGGNQQKVVLARALASSPKLLVLVNPLVGVDVASNRIIYDTVKKVAAAGTGVLIVSDEADELSICDSIQVIVKGQLTRRFNAGVDLHSLISAIEGVE
ncbi:Ribose import ATP-binding protein RbsA [compost metagenome]